MTARHIAIAADAYGVPACRRAVRVGYVARKVRVWSCERPVAGVASSGRHTIAITCAAGGACAPVAVSPGRCPYPRYRPTSRTSIP